MSWTDYDYRQSTGTKGKRVKVVITHREIYIDNWKYSLCFNDRINIGWVTTNDDAKVTCKSCIRVINKIDRIKHPSYKKKNDTEKAVKLLKKRRRYVFRSKGKQ